jgi:hypothetical protein
MEVGMATKITVALEDDLDGGPANETVRFGVGGAEYEIDLNNKNAAAFLRHFGAPVGAALWALRFTRIGNLFRSGAVVKAARAGAATHRGGEVGIPCSRGRCDYAPIRPPVRVDTPAAAGEPGLSG